MTVISFLVSVPVLSVQISLAPPIVSVESNFLTKLFSLLIFITEKAKAKVTAIGSPSGTAITNTVIPVMKVFVNSVVNYFIALSLSYQPIVGSITLLIARLQIPAIIAKIAQIRASLPIWFAIVVNLA